MYALTIGLRIRGAGDGRLTARAESDPTGSVAVPARAGRRTVQTRRAAARLRNGDCAYSARPTFRQRPRGAQRLRVTARFGGNAAGLAKVSPARTARLS